MENEIATQISYDSFFLPFFSLSLYIPNEIVSYFTPNFLFFVPMFKVISRYLIGLLFCILNLYITIHFLLRFYFEAFFFLYII